jgi:septal ring factor EnvC (AmiA/AmiB activator)
MKGVSIIKLALLIFCFSGISGFSQTKEQLQKQRDELNKKIEYTKKLINETKKNQEAEAGELQILKEQINYRSQLIKSFESELRGIEDDIQGTERSIRELEAKIALMKEEYAAMIYQAYKNRKSHDELMYIFAASDFNQAFKRFKVLQEYADYRKKQANEIYATQEKMKLRVVELEKIRAEKQQLLQEKSEETKALDADRRESEQVLNKLKQDEQKLRKQQQQQEAERQKINAAIKKKIEEELAAEKKKSGGKYELTPEGKVISEKFEQNKGQLPWPVRRGVVTERFGKHPHPTLAGIVTDNNGIDITTDVNATVSAIFGGTVTSVFSIPGAGQNVIVTHGGYKTVYTNLKDVSVSKGDKVALGDVLGIAMEQNAKGLAHIEVWKMSSTGGEPQNPELWLKKR